MRFVGPVVSQSDRVSLALVVILLSGAHIPTGSVGIVLQYTLTVAAVLAALQQKVHSAVVAALGKVASAQSAEEVKVQKRAKAVKGVYLAEFFSPIRSAVDLMTHLHGAGRDQPLIVVLVGNAPGVLDKPFRHPA